MNISNELGAVVMAATLLAEVQAAAPEVKAGAPASVVTPSPVRLFTTNFNLSISWTPTSGGLGLSGLLGEIFAASTVASALLAGGAQAVQDAKDGKPFSVSASLSLYGHHGSLSIGGSPA